MIKKIEQGEILKGENVSLRLITLSDCNGIYLSWLEDKAVNQYLETRWNVQSMETIKSFVSDIIQSEENYLFAIIENLTEKHIGNIKIGPINNNHSFADVSYFIGDKTTWGKGYATEAIRIITDFGFERLNLHRLQAGLYEENIGSEKCLIKAGYVFEGRLRKKLKSNNGWQDHKWFGILKEEWKKNQAE